MDCKEFDRYAPEYAEGLLEAEVRNRMDGHRATCQSCDQLARVHENMLRALNETPVLPAPAHLRHNILAAVAREEARLAEEKSAYRRMLAGALSAAAALGGILAAAWYLLFRETSLAHLERASTGVGDAPLSRLLAFLQTANEFLQHGFSLPGFEQTVPFYYLSAALGMALTLVWLAWYQGRAAGVVTI